MSRVTRKEIALFLDCVDLQHSVFDLILKSVVFNFRPFWELCERKQREKKVIVR